MQRRLGAKCAYLLEILIVDDAARLAGQDETVADVHVILLLYVLEVLRLLALADIL